MEDHLGFFDRFKVHLAVVLLVAIAIGTLLLFSKTQLLSPYKIEVINATPTPSGEVHSLKTLKIDVAGAVANPGVYDLQQGSRIGDAIDAAGGLSKNADTLWFEKNINRAAPIVDGQKMYIPSTSEQRQVLSANNSTGGSEAETWTPVPTSTKTNINTASQKELEDLWGIGPVIAKKLIDNRPYSEVSELLSKKILSKNVYDRIHSELSVF